jgi:hypothetical protein
MERAERAPTSGCNHSTAICESAPFVDPAHQVFSGIYTLGYDLCDHLKMLQLILVCRAQHVRWVLSGMHTLDGIKHRPSQCDNGPVSVSEVLTGAVLDLSLGFDCDQIMDFEAESEAVHARVPPHCFAVLEVAVRARANRSVSLEQLAVT